jgi:lipopolysaccharide/colanic/teichoic acid biosynthesis glycosyltransferase
VLYRQERVGFGGTPFTVYKFRTMLPDRRAARSGSWDGVDRRISHKTLADPRHTRVGQFLRKWSLDELPQLVNVLRGEMSLVGPRPELPHIVERYQPWEHARHAVRPGLTGFWQTRARSDGPMHDFTYLDLDYVRTVSPATDLKVLAMTLPAMLGSQRGS